MRSQRIDSSSMTATAETAAVVRTAGSARSSTGSQIDASSTPHETADTIITDINAKTGFLIAAPPGNGLRTVSCYVHELLRECQVTRY